MGWARTLSCVESRKQPLSSVLLPFQIANYRWICKNTNRQKVERGAAAFAAYMLVSFPFPFWLSQSPGPVNILLVHFFALGLGLPFGLCVCWIMQIKWHISMSVAILLLQFSSLTPFQNAINVSRRGRRLSCRPFNSRKANRKVAINPAKGLQLDLVNLKFNCNDRFICHT